jgi:hypothetical protein
MYQFGSNVKHIIDCHETNDEIIGRTKAYALSSRHKTICPSLIPLSGHALKYYEQDTKDTLDKYLADFKYLNAKVGMAYNLFPV